mmetsp:Transcript_3196/g.4933  ORF Transcript_3196/g.4933 Transcript_3196/m.4933 type:complete len:255 (-) Transcript_3196:201-965(-)
MGSSPSRNGSISNRDSETTNGASVGSWKEGKSQIKMKVLMLGDAGCGKTSLIQRFVHQEFQLEYAATVGIDLVAMDTKLENGKSAQVQIWDTAGQERFRHLTQNYYRGCHGVVLVYDLTCQESFRHVFSWIKDLKAAADGNFEVVLIANKLDLAPERVVEAERGQLLANEIKAEFFECSALDGSHVDAAFTSLIQKAGSAVAASEQQQQQQQPKAASTFTLEDEKRNNRSSCCLFRRKTRFRGPDATTCEDGHF